MRPPDELELVTVLDQLRDQIDGLEKGDVNAFGLLKLARTRTRIGFRTSSGLNPGGWTNVLDEDGNPVPHVSDPTGEAVVNEDPLARLRQRMVRGLRQAQAGLRDAAAAVAESAPPEPGEGDARCQVHARIVDAQGRPYFEPVEKGKEPSERCWWCNDFRYLYGEDPITGLLEAKARGQRITTKLIEQEYAKLKRKVPKLSDAYVSGGR